MTKIEIEYFYNQTLFYTSKAIHLNIFSLIYYKFNRVAKLIAMTPFIAGSIFPERQSVLCLSKYIVDRRIRKYEYCNRRDDIDTRIKSFLPEKGEQDIVYKTYLTLQLISHYPNRKKENNCLTNKTIMELEKTLSKYAEHEGDYAYIMPSNIMEKCKL